MRVYVVRHGESAWNVTRQWSGWTDCPLTEKGRADAAKAGEFLKSVSFDRVYASDLSRARETAEIAVPGCQCEVTPLLREVNVGTLAGQPWTCLTPEDRARIAVRGYADYDGESQEEFRGRIVQIQKKLEGLDCENVALFAHGGWLRCILETVLEAKLSKAHLLCNNCTIAIFDYTNGIWKLHSWINLS